MSSQAYHPRWPYTSGHVYYFFMLLEVDVLPILLSANLFLNLPNRILRHWNIRKHGYPPAHCDADGDFREVEKEE